MVLRDNRAQCGDHTTLMDKTIDPVQRATPCGGASGVVTGLIPREAWPTYLDRHLTQFSGHYALHDL